MRHFVFPDELLASLADSVLVQWTAQWRRECLVFGLQAYRHKVKDPSTILWLNHWIANSEQRHSQSLLAPLIDNADDWRRLREANYAADDILRLCDPKRRLRLSQHLICALVFDWEIFALTGEGEKPLLPSEQLRCHCRLLRRNSAYQKAYCPSGGPHVDWHQLVRYFATALAPAGQLGQLEY